MELRHYITFAVAIVVLQLLVYCFARTMGWLFQLSEATRKKWQWLGYLLANAPIALHLLHIYPLFRPMAFILAILLLSFFASSLIWLITFLYKRANFGKNWHFGLRLIYLAGFFGLMSLSVYNAYTPKVVHYAVTLDKPLAPLRIGVASDFHLGKLFGGKQLDQLAEIFKQQQVDLILLPGDMMDDNIDAYVAEKMQPHLAKLQAPLGVYATLGNHDFLGEQLAIAEQLQQAGIQVLWDKAISVEGKFVLIGRNDDLNKTRPTAAQLLQSVDSSLPVFLMDHRPSEIMQHSELPIDLQVSGHTHNGQIFPANLIVKLMYRLSYGYEKIGNGHYFVTSGYGFWGIPMRLGSQSEVFIIDVKGK